MSNRNIEVKLTDNNRLTEIALEDGGVCCCSYVEVELDIDELNGLIDKLTECRDANIKAKEYWLKVEKTKAANRAKRNGRTE